MEPATRLSADEALARIVAGNDRFRRGDARPASLKRATPADLAKGQQPFATILGCSDSRVPPEWIFDAGLGELFVVRVAGNVFSPEIAGSLQYAGSHLETPLFVVLGHQGCGAVQAALDTKQRGAHHRSRIQILVDSILAALPEVDPELGSTTQLAQAVECNVRWTVRQILNTREAQARIPQGRMRIVGAIHEIDSGRVRFLSDGWSDLTPRDENDRRARWPEPRLSAVRSIGMP
jgi:carbonic anhydrase